jgi:diguanylate cyclase (GGDEF)-like protein
VKRSVKQGRSLSELAGVLAAVEAAGDVLYDWDVATDRLRWAGAASGLFGEGQQDLPRSGEEINGFINPEDVPLRLNALSAHFTEAAEYDCEYRIRSEGGGFQWVHDRGRAEFSATGTPVRMVGVLRLVTRRKQHEARLEYLANFDGLTGQFNKIRLREALDQALAQGLRFGQDGAFLVLGLDQMGRINAAYGHEAGDRVLFDIAQRLDRSLRNVDVIGRLDSDRFGIVLTACGNQRAHRAAERVLQTVRQAPVKIGERQVHVSASVGVVLFPAHARTSFDVITKAEGALMTAKAAGRDCIRVYEMTEEQRRGHLDNMAVGEKVKLAIKDNRLTFAYQPIVCADTNEVRFYECLLRMRTPGGALVAAERFVPVVEQLGLMRNLDRRALDLAIHDLERYPDVKLALNISGLTATDRSWLRTLVARLEDRPELARRLIVEITETAALHDIEESAKFVTAVRDLGCQVAIDDFGAGYTTFRHLKTLTVDVVKIDGSFVHNISESAENQLFVRNLLSLARTFNLVTVAECVETAEEASYLLREGVDLLQGYYFGKPQVSPSWKLEADTAAHAQAVGEPASPPSSRHAAR